MSINKLTSAPFCKALFLIFFPFSVFSQEISIDGNLKAENSFIFISYLLKKGTVVDSIPVKENKFKTMLESSVDKKYRVKFKRDASEYFDFYYSYPSTHLEIDKNIKNTIIRNPSDLQIDFLNHENYAKTFWDENKKYLTAENLTSEPSDRVNLRNDEIRDSINNLRITHELHYYRNNPVSLSSLESLELLLKRKYGRARYKEFKDILEIIPAEFDNTPQVVAIKDFIDICDKYHNLKKLPSILGKDVNGENINTDSLTKGRFLLIDFWASWCVPCRGDHPQLINLYQANRRKFEILSISIDENTDLWRKAILDDGINQWKHLSVKENALHLIRRDLMVFSIPVRILVGSDGKIIKRWEGASETFVFDIKNLLNN